MTNFNEEFNRRYLIGSRLLHLENINSDFDFLVIGKMYIPFPKNGINFHKISEEELLKMLNFSSDNLSKMKYIYMLDADIIKQDFPYKFHILEHRNELISFLKKIIQVDDQCFHQEKNNMCSKELYHIVYLLSILKNNSINLSEEQFKIIKKIHDKNMPYEYLTEIKQEIENL